MKHILFRVATKVTIFATVFLTVLGSVTPSAYATAFDTVRMDLSRVKAATATSSTFTIVLPGSIDWDATTASDTIIIAYPTSSATWVFTTPNWTSADFLIYDGTQLVTIANADVASSTVSGTNFSSATVSCTTGGTGSNNGQVFINTTDLKFFFRRCGGVGGVAPGAPGTIKITIKGGGSGTLTTPAAANNVLVAIDMKDEGTEITHSDQVATSIITSDAASNEAISPTGPTMTFVVAQDAMASSAAAACSDTNMATTVAFGFANPLSITQINNATSTICTKVTATTGAAVTVSAYSLNGGLKISASNFLNSGTGTSDYSSASEVTLVTGVSTDDGICILGTTDTGGLAGESALHTESTTYGGTCNYTAMGASEQLGTLPTLANGGLNAIWTSTGDATGDSAHIVPRASISSATAAGTYADTYYFVASAAF